MDSDIATHRQQPSGRVLPVKGIGALFCLIILLIAGCGITPPVSTTRLQNIPPLIDDADRASLVRATQRQLNYLNRLPSDAIVRIQGDTYTIGWLAESLRLFLDIVSQNPTPEELDATLRSKFLVYQSPGRDGAPAGEMLITGYYEPSLEGSLVKRPPFIYPLYAKPDSLCTRNDRATGKLRIGRLDGNGNMLPFWTRGEIEDQRLLAGNELVYVKDPLDAYFLHIQGSGRIRLRDGSSRLVLYSGSNGREYKSIGKLLVDENKMPNGAASMQAIKRYLREHPDEIRRVLHHNSKFIFFKWGEKGPIGSVGEVLTPGRSIAIDRDVLPTAVIGYMVTRRPLVDQQGTVTGWTPMRRFVLPQDSGTAIKGTGRVDFFWGNGDYEEAAAGQMKEKGQLYFLVKKRS
ncbi:MAG: MltA domain-containing protein [Desulfocapsaceae bacterium]|nr:MltA domain-containing protein [Desulfocapsaceae bacterium]